MMINQNSDFSGSQILLSQGRNGGHDENIHDFNQQFPSLQPSKRSHFDNKSPINAKIDS